MEKWTEKEKKTTLREGGQASTSSRYMYTGWRVEWTIYSKLANKLCSASHKTFVLAQEKTAYHDHSLGLVCPVLSCPGLRRVRGETEAHASNATY
ncbi:hypothetical protein ACLKA6_002747 [Drosophila palustris]